MAESGAKKPAKKRQLKKTETDRQRVERGASATPRQRRVKKAAGTLSTPLRAVLKGVRTILRPFSFVLIPFKTKPARAIGRVLSAVLLLKFFREAWAELRQVQWPNARETARLTMAVFIFSLVFGAIIAATDYGLDKVFKKVFID
jgi:preprotein translocase SecE subunit